jgi:hypothetical protein
MDNPVDPTQNQYVPQPDPVQQDDAAVQAPGSLDYVPPKIPGTGAENAPVPVETAPVTEAPPTPETQPSIETLQPEVLTPAEAPQTQPQAQQPQHQEPADNMAPIPQETTLEEQLVDKTDEPTQLHSVQDTRDKLTAAADREEEEFIKNVEAAHEHN